MIHVPRVLSVFLFAAALTLPVAVLTACADEVVEENAVVAEEADPVAADAIAEPSVEEAVEAREEGEPPSATSAPVEPVGEAGVAGIEEQVAAQIESLGETVTLAGTVTEVLGERTFVFAPASDADPLLMIVVADATLAPELGAESAVTVDGAVVAAFYVEDVEKVTGLDLDDDLLDDYQGSPAFVAGSVVASD